MRISDWSSDVCSSDLSWRSLSSKAFVRFEISVSASRFRFPCAREIASISALRRVTREFRSSLASDAALICFASSKRFWRPSSSRSEEHTSELQSLMRISYAVFCLKKKTYKHKHTTHSTNHCTDSLKH